LNIILSTYSNFQTVTLGVFILTFMRYNHVYSLLSDVSYCKSIIIWWLSVINDHEQSKFSIMTSRRYCVMVFLVYDVFSRHPLIENKNTFFFNVHLYDYSFVKYFDTFDKRTCSGGHCCSKWYVKLVKKKSYYIFILHIKIDTKINTLDNWRYDK